MSHGAHRDCPLVDVLARYGPIWDTVIRYLGMCDLVAAGVASKDMRALFHDRDLLARRMAADRSVLLATGRILRFWNAPMQGPPDAPACERDQRYGSAPDDTVRCDAAQDSVCVRVGPPTDLAMWRAYCLRLSRCKRSAAHADVSPSVAADIVLAAATCGDGVFLNRWVRHMTGALEPSDSIAFEAHARQWRLDTADALAHDVWAEEDADLARILPVVLHVVMVLLECVAVGPSQRPCGFVRRRPKCHRMHPYEAHDGRLGRIEDEALYRLLDALPLQWTYGRATVSQCARRLVSLVRHLSLARQRHTPAPSSLPRWPSSQQHQHHDEQAHPTDTQSVKDGIHRVLRYVAEPTPLPAPVRRAPDGLLAAQPRVPLERPGKRPLWYRDRNHHDDDDDNYGDDGGDHRESSIRFAAQCLCVASTERGRWHTLLLRTAAHVLDVAFPTEAALAAHLVPVDSKGGQDAWHRHLVWQAFCVQTAPWKATVSDPTVDRVMDQLASLV